MKALALTLLCGLVAVAVQAAQKTAITAASLEGDAIRAYQAKDYAKFLGYEKEALKLEPSNPRILYNVACGESLTGHGHEAIGLLEQLLSRNLDLGAEADPDFAEARKSPEWEKIESGLAKLRTPLVRSKVAFTIPEAGLLATGIAVEPRTGDMYIASVRERKILRRTRNGDVSDFIHAGQDGFLAGASLAIDEARHVLIASTAAVPFMAGYRQEEAGQSGVFEFDLGTGKLIGKVMLAADGGRHFLNALAVDGAGTVYVSDSLASGIYRLVAGRDRLEQLVPGAAIPAAQGLALSDDGKTLYVADYATGLWAVDLASRMPHRIPGPENVWLGGLDGLSRVKDGFISVQIGVKPERVLRLRMDREWQRIEAAEILEMGHPRYDGPIQGAVAGDAFFYVANSQLSLGNGETGAFAADRGRPTIVLQLPLH